MEKEKSCCSSSGKCCKSTCIATLALCISLFVFGILIGNCMAKCNKVKKCRSNKVCNISGGDAVSGSTCNFNKSKCSKRKKVAVPPPSAE